MAIAADEDDASLRLQRLAEEVDGAPGHSGRIHAVLKLDDHESRQSETNKGLALACAADGAEQIIGVDAGAWDGRVADATGQLAADAPGRYGNGQPAI